MAKAELLEEIEKLRRKVNKLEAKESKKSERKATNRFEIKFQTVVDASPVGILLHSDGRILYANPAALKILRMKAASAVLGKPILDFIHPKDRAKASERMRQIVQKGGATAIKRFRYLSSVGKTVSVESFGRLIDVDYQPTILTMINDISARLRSEKALRESERRLSELIDFLPDPAFAIDREGKVIVWNRAIAKMTGVPPEDILGKADQAYSLAFYGEKRPMLIDLAFGSDPGIESRYRLLRREEGAVVAEVYDARVNMGRGAYMWGKAAPMMDRSSKVTGAIEIIRDISARKKLEDDLRESRNMLQIILDTVPVRVFWKDARLRYLGCNVSFAADAGLKDPREIVGKDDSQMPWKDQAVLYQKDDRLVISSNHVKLGYEEPQNTPEGDQIWLRTSKVPLRSGAGEIIGVLGTYEDITGRKRTEQALRESELRFKALVDSSPDGIIILDLDGKIVGLNRSLARITGYRHEDLVNRHYNEFIGEQHLVGIGKALDSFITGVRRDAPVQIEFRRKDGLLIQLHIHGFLVTAEDSRSIAIGAFVRDVTDEMQVAREKEQLNNQLQQAQKMEAIGALAAGIAHDFNNILSVIIGNADLLDFSGGLDLSCREYLGQIQSASKRAKELVRQILSFSRQENLEKVPVNLKTIVKETIDFIRSSLPATIEVKFNSSADVGTVIADPTQMQQILMNLCANAGHAMEGESGTLSIGLDKTVLPEKGIPCDDAGSGEYVRLIVADTGRGMDPTTCEKIFEPYFTTKDKGKGTGLGLSVVHGIVKSHGGQINVASQVGKGTTFEVLLPCSETAAEKLSDTRERLLTGTECILFVDDEPALTNIAKDILGKLGYTVEVRTSPVEAIAAFKANPQKFDVIITDMTMPQMTGLALSRQILEIRNNIPIILCTGFSDRETEKKIRSAGIRSMQYKPLVLRELAETIRKVIEDKIVPGPDQIRRG